MGRETRSFTRKSKTREVRPIFIIATEGEKTEKIYFNMFRNPSIHIKILPTKKGRSSPDKVLKRLNQYCRENKAKTNEVWLVVDVDEWGREKLDAVTAAAKAKGYSIAVSNPCFEIWLLLHQRHEFTPEYDRKGYERQLSRLLGGYSKNNYDPRPLKSFIADAIRKAKLLDRNKKSLWPRKPGSHVYKLVEKFK